MSENAMYICGFSMEMELAEEMGTIGRCISCIHHQGICNSVVNCELNGKIKEKEDCNNWSIDIR